MHNALLSMRSECPELEAEAREIRKTDKRLSMQASLHKLLLPRIYPMVFESEFERRLSIPERIKMKLNDNFLARFDGVINFVQQKEGITDDKLRRF